MTANVRRRAACSTASFAEVPGAACSSRALTWFLPTPRGTGRGQEEAHSDSNRVGGGGDVAPATSGRRALRPRHLEGPRGRDELLLRGDEQDLPGTGVLGALQETEHRRGGAAE